MQKKNLLLVFKVSMLSSLIFAHTTSQATPLFPSLEFSSKYLGIQLGNENSGAGQFSVGSGSDGPGSDFRSALGRINPVNDKPATEPAAFLPASDKSREIPTTERTSSFGGNIALTNNDTQIGISTTDVYSSDAGIECARVNCLLDGSTSNSNFFVPGDDVNYPIGTNAGKIEDGFGVQGGVDFAPLLSEIAEVRSFVQKLKSGTDGYDFTNILDLTGSGGNIDDRSPKDGGTDFVLSDYTQNTLIDGLNIIDVRTDGNDFNINNSNFIVDGSENSFFLFVVEDEENMLITNSRIIAGADMGLNNIMFVVENQSNDTHFNFSQSEVWGAAFWDLSALENTYDGHIVMNNVRGCGQWVSNHLGDWNDFSLDRCAASYATVPPPPPTDIAEPANFAVFGLSLAFLGWRNRRSQ